MLKERICQVTGLFQLEITGKVLMQGYNVAKTGILKVIQFLGGPSVVHIRRTISTYQ